MSQLQPTLLLPFGLVMTDPLNAALHDLSGDAHALMDLAASGPATHLLSTSNLASSTCSE
jgi:hypothetical protein